MDPDYAQNLSLNLASAVDKGVLAIRRIFSLVDMIAKPKF